MALLLTKSSDLDLSDPRVRKTCLRALEWLGDLSVSKLPREIAAKTIIAQLGNTSRGVGKMLKGLLHQHGSYSTITGKSYSYSTNEEAFERFEAKLGVRWDFIAWAKQKGYSFTTAPAKRSAQPRTHDRVYPWWVTMRKTRRFELFAAEHGVVYDYDIEVAKPALTLQAFNKSYPGISLQTWTAYVANRSAVRQTLVDDLNITNQQAKMVCQDVLNSATASIHHKNGLFQRLGETKTLALMEHPIYQGLAADFKTYWKHTKAENTLGLTAGEYVSKLYNSLEWQVMDVIEAELGQSAWFVHDGFMTVKPVDMDDLCVAVKNKTGFDIKLSEAISPVPHSD